MHKFNGSRLPRPRNDPYRPAQVRRLTYLSDSSEISSEIDSSENFAPDECTVSHPEPLNPKVQSKTKKQLLPPPGEMTATEEDKTYLMWQNYQGRTTNWDFVHNQPMTWSQKRARRDMIKEARGGDTGRESKKMSSIRNELEEESEGPARKKQGSKLVASIMTTQFNKPAPIAKQGRSKSCAVEEVSFTTAFRSIRAKRVKQQQRMAKGSPFAVPDVNFLREYWAAKRATRNNRPFRLLELPEEIRQTVHRLSVVEDKFFIWPETAAGFQQPDLSMVCSQIRKEVLPIFYGENTFGVAIPAMESSKPLEYEDNLARAAPWAQSLSAKSNERGKWLNMIRSWAFTYTDPESIPSPTRGFNDEETHNKFVVWIQLTGLTYPSALRTEIHSTPACLSPPSGKHDICLLRPTPKWFSESMMTMLSRPNRAPQVVEMAKALGYNDTQIGRI